MATRNAIADVLDLMHRLPRTWAACERGEAEVWVARKVAKLSRHLSLDRVAVVDAAVARVIASETAGRVISLAEGKVVEADPDLHDQRVETERRRRYVAVTRTDEAGLRTVIARVQAGDAVWVDATVERVADIIAPQHPDVTRGELRSIAFGYLARPAELLTLLLEHTEAIEPASEEPPNSPSRATAFPADLLAALKSLDLTRLAPRCTLYVHLHEAALLAGHGVARVEGLGPVTLDRLAELLARTDLTVKPVIDLSDRVRTTAYEHPESLKERVHLITGGDYWPYATSVSRAVDYDHPRPYQDPDHGGPPGRTRRVQTGVHNSGPLGRRHHRWKTLAGYRARQSGHGRYAWLTPHGLAYVVDHRGTRRIEPDHARMIIDAPPGVDIYPTDDTIELDQRLALRATSRWRPRRSPESASPRP
jgi:antitoxin (DNA-binding transcriptional repressor) of toxin-antitoxin stability system